MRKGRVALVPDRMTERQLIERILSLSSACRWTANATVEERERFLEQIDACARELRMRGTQLRLV